MKKTDYFRLGCPEPETGKPRMTEGQKNVIKLVTRWVALIKKRLFK